MPPSPALDLAAAFLTAPRDRNRSIASLFLHPGCNVRCRFCVSETGFDTMGRADAEALLLALRDAGISNVVFGGGEPTTWPHDLWSLCERAREAGHFVQVSTNGVALPGGFARDTAVDRFLLPLESADAAVHDALRGAPGHHRLVLARLAELAAAGRAVTITTVANRASAGAIPPLAETLRTLARDGLLIHAWHLYRFVAAGRGGAGAADELGLDRETWLGALRAVRRVDLGFRVFVRPDVRRSRDVEYVWVQERQLRLGSVEFPAALSAPAGG